MGNHYIKKRKIWVIKAYDRAKKEMIAWVTGTRSAKILRNYMIK